VYLRRLTPWKTIHPSVLEVAGFSRIYKTRLCKAASPMTVQSLPIGGWNDLPPELWCDVINRIDSGYHGVIACVSRSLHANVRDCEQSRKCGRTSVPHSSQPRTYVRRNVLSMKSASSRRLPIRVSLICRYGGSVMLSWARAAGCPWNARLAASLATLGGAAAIRMLRWAREENMPPCPWDSEVCNIAAEVEYCPICFHCS